MSSSSMTKREVWGASMRAATTPAKQRKVTEPQYTMAEFAAIEPGCNLGTLRARVRLAGKDGPLGKNVDHGTVRYPLSVLRAFWRSVNA